MVDLSDLRARRERLRLSRERLGRLADVAAGTIFNIEKGLVPGDATAEKIAAAVEHAEQQASVEA